MATATPATASIASQDSSWLRVGQEGVSNVESSLREFQWQLQLRARLQTVVNSICKHFHLQNVCCAQVWLSATGCQQEQNLGQMQLYADPNLVLMGDPAFASFRQLSCQALLPGRYGMPGRAWTGGCVQVVQNLAIIPACLHPRSRLTPPLAQHVAEVVYITVYDPARPHVGPVAVLEALFSSRSTDSMMVANFISWVGSALLQTQLTLCDPAPKQFRGSKLAGRKPVLVSEPDVVSSHPGNAAQSAAAAAAEAAIQAAQQQAQQAVQATAADAAKPAAAAAAAAAQHAHSEDEEHEGCEDEGHEGTADNEVTAAAAAPTATLPRVGSAAGMPAAGWLFDQQCRTAVAPVAKPASSEAGPAAAATTVLAVATISTLSDVTAMGPPPAPLSAVSAGGNGAMPAPSRKRAAGSSEAAAAAGGPGLPVAKRLARATSMGRTKSVPVDLHALGEVASTASSKPQLAS